MSTVRDTAPGAWLGGGDHKIVGLSFLGWTLIALLLGGILGLLTIVRSLAGDPDTGLIFQTMTYHRVVLVFLFLVPAVPSVLGHFLLPMQIRAPEMALPAFSRLALRLHAAGLLLTVLSFVFDPVATGWTFATPLSLTEDGSLGLLAVGLCLAALGWFLTGVNIIATVHHRRAADMGFFDMPVSAWGFYLSGYQLTVSGALFAVSIGYLAAARYAGHGPFGADADPLVWAGYFRFALTQVAWFSLVPLAGMMGRIVSGLSRKPVANYNLFVGSLIALTGLGALSWGAPLGGLGMDPSKTFAWSAIALLGVIPAAIIAWTWLSTLYRGAVACTAATTFSMGFFLHAGLVAMMGLLLTGPASGAYLQRTMFATAQLDYLIWGACLSGLLAGLHYWWPRMTGRMYDAGRARGWAMVYVLGLNLALLPRAMAGLSGAPGDLFLTSAGATTADWLTGAGWTLVWLAVLSVLYNLVSSAWSGDEVGEDYWSAGAPD